MFYAMELMVDESDAKQSEFDANLEARVFASNFELWQKVFYKKDQQHEDDIPDDEIEWADTPEAFFALLREAQSDGALS